MLGITATHRQHRNWRGLDAKEIIDRLGLGTSLELCLDAGDATSAPSSTTSWIDISGNGYDFFLGTDATAQASDPTQTGTVGALTLEEYFSFDAGDYFTYDTTNETWMQNLHKDNAAFTCIVWVYPGAIGAIQGLFGTCGAIANTGIAHTITAAGDSQVDVRNAGTAALTQLSGAPGVLGATRWQMAAV